MVRMLALLRRRRSLPEREEMESTSAMQNVRIMGFGFRVWAVGLGVRA